jgi:hypothetical protein
MISECGSEDILLLHDILAKLVFPKCYTLPSTDTNIRGKTGFKKQY